MKKTALGIMLLLLIIAAVGYVFNVRSIKANSETICVDGDNTDGPWDGTPQHPYQNITSGLEHASANDTIFVYNGTYYERVHVNKSVSLVGENKHGAIIDGNFTGTVVAITADNVNVANFTIRNARAQPPTGHGVSMNFSKDCNISNNIITNNLVGIWLWGSSNNTIADNQVFFPDKITNIGVALRLSDGNTLINNTIPSVYDSIFLSSSNHNTIKSNKLYSNWWGIRLHSASNNTIVANNISNCKRGIYSAYGGINNVVCHNNFVNNTEQAVVYNSTNIWHSGYPSGGNYWSDYGDRYPAAEEVDDSGIWDTPYVIDENNKDNYPLMEPWSPARTVVTASLDVDPDMLNLRSKGKWITGYIELPESYNISDINASTILLNATIPVDMEASGTIGDYDSDTVPDLMVNFNRTSVVEYVLSKGIIYGNATLSIAGKLYGVVFFEGSYTIKVSLLGGDINCDGKVTIYDVVMACASYGSGQGEPDWNSNANFAPPWNIIDIYDIVTIAYHYGETHP